MAAVSWPHVEAVDTNAGSRADTDTPGRVGHHSHDFTLLEATGRSTFKAMRLGDADHGVLDALADAVTVALFDAGRTPGASMSTRWTARFWVLVPDAHFQG